MSKKKSKLASISSPEVDKLDKVDKLALCILRSMYDADRQTSQNPVVFWRYFTRGIEAYLEIEGLSKIAKKAKKSSDDLVQYMCFHTDPGPIADAFMSALKSDKFM